MTSSWKSLTRGQRTVLAASAAVTLVAAGIWGLGGLSSRGPNAEAARPPGPPARASQPASGASSPGNGRTPGSHRAAPGRTASRAPVVPPAPRSSPAAAPSPAPPSAPPPAGHPTPSAAPPTSPGSPPGHDCVLVPAARGSARLSSSGKFLTLAAGGPGLSYQTSPPELAGSTSAPRYAIVFRYLGHQAGGHPRPGTSPPPGTVTFLPTLTGAQLGAGSVAEVYATGARARQRDYLSILRIVRPLPGGGLLVRFTTYARACGQPGPASPPG